VPFRDIRSRDTRQRAEKGIGVKFYLATMCVTTLFPVVAYGQIHIEGSVRDANNAPLGGVRVTVQIAASGTVQGFSDPGGRFSLRAAAAGPYEIVAEKEGYYAARLNGATLDADGVDVALVLYPVGTLNESIDVTTAPTTLDMDSTTTKRSLSGRTIIDVPYPNTNDLRNAMRAVPGVVRDSRGGLHVNGAAEEQVLFTLNGFNVNDPLTGRFDSRMSVESVQSVEISSGNLTAEFGKGSGGTVAVRSQTGDDRFRYSATNFVPGYENRKGWTIGDWTPRFGIAGPIRRGRAWFSNSSDVQYVKTVVRELPKGEDRNSSLRLSNMLTGQVNLTPSNIVHAGFLMNSWNAPRTGMTAIDPVETTVDRRSRQYFFHIKDQMYFRRGMLIEVGYGSNRTYGREIPQGHQMLSYTSQGKRGNYFVDGTRYASRDQILANAFLPSFSFWGGHQLKAGFDLNHLAYSQDVRRTGYQNYSDLGVRTRRTVFSGSGVVRKTNEEASFYLQDSWRPRARLLVEAGMRGDWDRLVGRWNGSPRLGVSWSPAGWDDTKFYGGFAQVFDATNLRLFSRPDDQSVLTSYYLPDGRLGRGPAITQFTIGGRRLDRPRSRNVSLGAAHTLANGVTVRTDYLRRRGARAFTYRSTDPPDGYAESEVFDSFYNLGNGRFDVFDSVSFSVRHVIRRQYEWMASYTKSRALSNAVVDVSLDDPTIVTENAGPMPWDAPHRFMGWAYLPLPRKDWAIACFLDNRSGFPFSTQNEDRRIEGKVNARRFPTFFEMNLHLERRFAYRGHKWAWRFGANNISNRINPDSLNPFVGPGQAVRFYGGTGRSFNARIRWLGRVL